MKFLTAAVVILSAFLLFLLEPIAARGLLPLYGGSAAVWTICLVFFQCAMLVGYLYAHLLVSRLKTHMQAGVHLLLLALALLSRPTPFHADDSAMNWPPVVRLLGSLSASIGLPFIALAATSPLLQAWYPSVAKEQRPIPWWIFALSNAASMLALFIYPAWFEPTLSLHRQIVSWNFGFALFALLCGILTWRHRSRSAYAPTLLRPIRAAPAGKTFSTLWIVLPASSSMLLCSVTSHLGENIAAIPLLWVIPLAAYLLSFVIAFAGPKAWPRFLSVRMLALTLATFAYLLHSSAASLPLQIAVPAYTAALLFACLFCHAELYLRRPGEAAITGYYLAISSSSALGAVLIGIAAPNLFRANYDLALSVIFLAVAALAATWQQGRTARLVWATATIGLIYIAGLQAKALGKDTLVQLRSFYGSLRVTETHQPPEAETTRTLFHGKIQHGTQLFGGGLRTQPSSYYAHASGMGLALDLCCGGRPRRIGVVGLGTGTVAAYGQPGDEITFYEINPLVERLARALFTYLRDTPAKARIVLGDARLSLAHEPANLKFDVLVLDAFSGDAVPVHLLTAEAIDLYRQHLAPDGILAFHISSQYLDLAPELTLQARHAGLQACIIHSNADESRGIFPADWLLISPGQLLHSPEIVNASQPLPSTAGLRLWTDNYSSLLPLLKWPSLKPAAQPMH